MNILFIHNTLPEYRIPWFKNMNKLCNVRYIFTNEKLNQKIYKNKIDYKKIKDIETLFLSDGIKMYKELWRLVKEIENYDFVQLPPIDSLREYIVSLVMFIYCNKKNIKTGYFWEKWEAPKEYQPIKRKLKNLILRTVAGSIFKNVDIIFAGGSKSKEYFINMGIEEEKIFIIPDVSETNSCNYINIREKYNISKNKKIILYFGRIISQKGLDILIKSFGKISNRDEYELLVVGDGEFKSYCEQIVKKLNIDNVIFTGWIHPDSRELYFSQCDIFVFPGTFRDGCVDVWGLTINEAIQHGKIVISTNAVGSAYDLIFDGQNGYFINAENEEDLVRALELANNEELKIRAVEKNKELCKWYSYDNMAKIYVDTVKKIVNKNSIHVCL